jgi:peptidoglycan hydrolase-like protein with peptidoglycan-binding domain
MKNLVCRTGNDAPRELARMLALYVWSEHGLIRGLNDARNELDAIRPDAIVLHASPREIKAVGRLAIETARQRHPWARIWLGVGIDGTVGQWRRGERTAANVVDPLLDVALLAERMGVEGVVWNGESEWKDTKADIVSPEQIQALAENAIKTIRIGAPSVIHALSSFAQPNYHSSLAAFLRGFSPGCSIFSGQAYVAIAGGASRGALPATLDAAARAQELADREGWLPDDVTTVDVATDCDRVPTVQGHQTPLADLVRACAELDHVFVWSVPMVSEGGRTDEMGLKALRFAATTRRAGMTIRQWQQSRGLAPDGVVGPATLASAGI